MAFVVSFGMAKVYNNISNLSMIFCFKIAQKAKAIFVHNYKYCHCDGFTSSGGEGWLVCTGLYTAF